MLKKQNVIAQIGKNIHNAHIQQDLVTRTHKELHKNKSKTKKYKQSNLKLGKRFEQTFYKRRYTCDQRAGGMEIHVFGTQEI